MKSWKTKQMRDLAAAIADLQSEKEVMAFLRDVATIEELTVLSKRWEAAQLIDAGFSYREIAKKTGLSTTTITRVAHWMKHGEGGYEAALQQ